MEKRSKIICGESFEISLPYSAGHICTEIEAARLNQVRSEDIGNNLRSKIKELIDAGKLDEAREAVTDYDANYKFTISVPSQKLDPVEREAISIAKDAIKNHLAETGRKLSKAPVGMTDEEWETKIQAEIDRLSQQPSILNLAKKRVAERQAVIESTATVLGA